jgi:integral membrane protein (TIGR01906 family)
MNKFVLYLAGVFLSIFMLGSSVSFFSFNHSFYLYEFEKYDIYNEIDMDKNSVNDAASAIINFLSLKENTMDVSFNGVRYFNDKELSHMDDVKMIFSLLIYLTVFSFVFVFIALILSKNKDKFKNVLLGSWYFSGILVIVLGFMVFTDFTKYFIKFHHIFFTNDNWLLDPKTDRLIMMLPEGFFMDMTIGIVSLYLALNIVLFMLNKTFNSWRK